MASKKRIRIRKSEPGEIFFLEIKAPGRLVFDHGSDKDNDPTLVRAIVMFESQADGETGVTMRQLHPTREQHQSDIGFGAVEPGYPTLEKLAQYSRGSERGRQFKINQR